jgi:hypothetical protein
MLVAVAALGAQRDAPAGDPPKPPVERMPSDIDELFVSADGKRAAALVSGDRRKGQDSWIRLHHDGAAKELVVRTPITVARGGLFLDGGASLLISGFKWWCEDGQHRSAIKTTVIRVADGVRLVPSDDPSAEPGPWSGLVERSLHVSSDEATLLALLEQGAGVEFLDASTGKSRSKIAVADPIGSILATAVDGDLLVLLKDERIARIACADGKTVWSTDAPHDGDDTTWSPGERGVSPARPEVYCPAAIVSADGTRAVLDLHESDQQPRSTWQQHIVVAYDWKDGKEVWRRRPVDQVMDEVFVIPLKSWVGFAHGSRANVYRHSDGELVGELAMDGVPDRVVFGAKSMHGWGATLLAGLFQIDASGLDSE